MLGESGTGPANDLMMATQLAAQMVGSFGMAGSLISFDAVSHGPIGGANLVAKVLADERGKQDVEDILAAQKERVLEVLAENRDVHPPSWSARGARRARPRRDPRGDRGDARGPRLNDRPLSRAAVDRSGEPLHALRHRLRRPHADREFRGARSPPCRRWTSAPCDPGRGRAGGHRGEQVDYAIVGARAPGRGGSHHVLQASIDAGLPKDVPAITINKVCLSSMSAIAMADQMERRIEVAVAGGWSR